MEKNRKKAAAENWMRKLGLHYETIKSLYPADRLMIMFDIDGTIIDMRQVVLHALNEYDRKNRTCYFGHIELEDITFDENSIGGLLRELELPSRLREDFLGWYARYRTSDSALLASHKPFRGVMELIRWFSDQPKTYICLNTGRPECIRRSTLKVLNRIGEEYGVRFRNEFLYMNPYDWNTKCTGLKAEGVRKYHQKGYRVFAFIDNEPENLLSVSRALKNSEILLMHASTIYRSSCEMLPDSAVSGKVYDVNEITGSY